MRQLAFRWNIVEGLEESCASNFVAQYHIVGYSTQLL